MPGFETYVEAHRKRRSAAAKLDAERARRALAEAERIARVLADKFELRRVVVFGSLARGRFREGSDIDLAVEGLTEGRLIEALTVSQGEFEVDIVPLERAPDHVRQAAMAEGITLWPR